MGSCLAAVDETFTLEGHLLIVDHGAWVSQCLLHWVPVFTVKEGDLVRQGQVLGTVGVTVGQPAAPALGHENGTMPTRSSPPLVLMPDPLRSHAV